MSLRELTPRELQALKSDVYPDEPSCESCGSLDVCFIECGSVLCEECSECYCCGRPLTKAECLNPDCRLYLSKAREIDR